MHQGCDKKYAFNDKLEWRWKISNSKEYVQCQDEKETRLCRRVTLGKMVHEEINDMEVEFRNGVLCEYVKGSRIKITCEHKRKPHLPNQTIRETDNGRRNRDSTLHACTYASVKDSMMAGYVMIKDDCEQWEKLTSISTNKWEKNISYSAEAITIYKAMLMIVEHKCDEKYETTCCISDNRKLVNVLSKNQAVHKDMTQDAGGIIEQILDVMNAMSCKLSFVHCKGNVEKPKNYIDDPISYMMSTCDTRSKEVRRALVGMTDAKLLEVEIPNQIEREGLPDHRAIQELVRTVDSSTALQEYVTHKFGQNGDLVDTEARMVFSGGGTAAQIKYSLGLNLHGKREKIMNKNKNDLCPACGSEEDWSHVIKCPRLKEKNTKLVERLNTELEKLENKEKVRWKSMVNDIKNYLANINNENAMQQVIGHDVIFRGFIVKDWFGNGKDELLNRKYNRVIVKLCVQHYWTCWKERNDIMNNKDVKRKFVMDWCENEVKKNALHPSKNVRLYVREYAGKVKNQATDHMQRWLIGLNSVIKREKSHGRNDIRRYAE